MYWEEPLPNWLLTVPGPVCQATRPWLSKMVAFNCQEVRPIEMGGGGSTSFVYEVPAGSTGYGFVVTPPKPYNVSMSWLVP